MGPDTEFQVSDVDLDRDKVSVVIAGPGEPPDVDKLGEILERELGRDVSLDLRIVAETRKTYSSKDA